MSSSARVTSLDALRDFKAAMHIYREEAQNGLLAVEMEAHRFLEWLKHDQMSYWQQMVRKCEEWLAEAKAELHRKKLTAINSDHRSLVEEQMAVRKAKARLENAMEKIEAIRKWVRELEHAFNEFSSHAQTLTNAIETDWMQAVAILLHKIKSIEAYLDIAATSDEPDTSGDSAKTAETAAEKPASGPASSAAETAGSSS